MGQRLPLVLVLDSLRADETVRETKKMIEELTRARRTQHHKKYTKRQVGDDDDSEHDAEQLVPFGYGVYPKRAFYS